MDKSNLWPWEVEIRGALAYDILRDDAPYCSQPDDRWPPQINACLREILRYRKQQIDPEGYRRELQEAQERAKMKKVKGSAEGGRNE